MTENREAGSCGCGGRVYTDGETLWCDSCENDWFPDIAIPDDGEDPEVPVP